MTEIKLKGRLETYVTNYGQQINIQAEISLPIFQLAEQLTDEDVILLMMEKKICVDCPRPDFYKSGHDVDKFYKNQTYCSCKEPMDAGKINNECYHCGKPIAEENPTQELPRELDGIEQIIYEHSFSDEDKFNKIKEIINEQAKK